MATGEDLVIKFWSHTKQHSSKTGIQSFSSQKMFWSHTKQHSSKTIETILQITK